MHVCLYRYGYRYGYRDTNTDVNVRIICIPIIYTYIVYLRIHVHCFPGAAGAGLVGEQHEGRRRAGSWA
jgi:hypothetical protein